MKDAFINEKACPTNPKWNNIITRASKLYEKENDVRSDFERDFNRVLHSDAYKRLKHKTQVFFSPKDDHVCTRIEHVNHVESISYSIANFLGLNTELTRAIATAHDLGHAPFGHKGEHVLSDISKREIGTPFWHEQNGLHLVDNIELLEDSDAYLENMNLTYAVRDGIISHCGEVDENSLKPRDEFIDLNNYSYPNQYKPYTWEGCVVKIADKISYIIRDIEDAVNLHIVDSHLDELYNLLNYDRSKKINNSNIIGKLVQDICYNSSVENGLCFSQENLKLLNKIKEFNYRHIYNHPRVMSSNDYFSLVINQIYNTLKSCYDGINTFSKLERLKVFYPVFIENFEKWIVKYWNLTDRTNSNLKNNILFDMNNEKDYCRAIIYYISGMSDNFAISTYMEIIGF